MAQKIQDSSGQPIEVGTPVIFGEDQRGVVVAISDLDGDWDDELGRATMIRPRVTVRFDDGAEDESSTTDITQVTWADYPDGPEVHVFEADDCEVAT